MKVVYRDLSLENYGIILHGCNAQGKMGSGVAKSIRDKYPQVFRDYVQHCEEHKNDLLGSIVITSIHSSLIIVSGITQEYYGRDPDIVYVNYEAIQKVFASVAALAVRTWLPVKYPMIGGGLGNGDFDIIKNIIQMELRGVPDHTLFIKE